MARSLVSCLVPCALITQLGACLQQVDAPVAPALVVDRREGDWAVVQHLVDGRIEEVPVSTLPADVREGDVLVRNQRAHELRELLLHGQRSLRSRALQGSFSLEDPPSSVSPDSPGMKAAASASRPGATVKEAAVTQALTAERER